ncbi:MAG TPA: KH domain-containing protein [Chloroflexota bacterium]
MKELIEYIARSLVDHPDQVKVRQVEGETSVIFELQVAQDDMGKIIGKEGRIANAIRTLLKVAAAREGKRAVLEII